MKANHLKQNHFSDFDLINTNSNTQKDKKQNNALVLGNTENIKSKPSAFNRYNNLPTKRNFNNSCIKTLVDIIAGAVVAPAISASLGKFAPLAGIGLVFGGNYSGDNSGLLRSIGTATLAHTIAKSKEYRQEDSTIKNRLEGITDDWLRFFLLKKETDATPVLTPDLTQSISGFMQEVEKANENEDSTLDLGELEKVEPHLESEAIKFEQEQVRQAEYNSLAREEFLEDQPKDNFEIELKKWKSKKQSPNDDFKEEEYSGTKLITKNWFDDDFDFSKM